MFLLLLLPPVICKVLRPHRFGVSFIRSSPLARFLEGWLQKCTCLIRCVFSTFLNLNFVPENNSGTIVFLVSVSFRFVSFPSASFGFVPFICALWAPSSRRVPSTSMGSVEVCVEVLSRGRDGRPEERDRHAVPQWRAPKHRYSQGGLRDQDRGQWLYFLRSFLVFFLSRDICFTYYNAGIELLSFVIFFLNRHPNKSLALPR